MKCNLKSANKTEVKKTKKKEVERRTSSQIVSFMDTTPKNNNYSATKPLQFVLKENTPKKSVSVLDQEDNFFGDNDPFNSFK